MGRCKQADHCGNPSWCTLTNSCLKNDPKPKLYGPSGTAPIGYTIEQLHAHAAAAVAEEQERWVKPVQAMLDAHDASLVRLGEMMRANGVTTIRIDGAAQAELDAIAALRSLVSATKPQSQKP